MESRMDQKSGRRRFLAGSGKLGLFALLSSLFGQVLSPARALALHASRMATSGKWYPVQQTELISSDGAASDEFGDGVWLSGNTLVAGAPFHSSTKGKVYIYTGQGANWTAAQTITASDATANWAFGYQVCVQGTWLIVGSPEKKVGTKTNAGGVYFYQYSAGTWGSEQKLTASDAAASDLFGYSVAVYGTQAAAGAQGKSSSQGAVYTFTCTGSTWAQSQEFTAPDGAASDVYGCSIALYGNWLFVGASGHKVGSNASQGACYVYNYSGSTWSFFKEFTALDGAANDIYGASVAVCGNYAVIGASGHASTYAGQGTAYVYYYNGSAWSLTQELVASDAAAGDGFGGLVTISGTVITVAAFNKTVGTNTTQGVVYVFNLEGGTWVQTARIVSSNGASGDKFGQTMAQDPNFSNAIVISAQHKQIGSNASQGAVYYFA